MKRKGFAVKLAMLCLLTVFAGCGQSDEKENEAGNGEYSFKYEIDNEKNNTIQLTGYEGKMPANVDIPNSIGKMKVTSIGKNAFSGCKEITNVSIPDSVVIIDTAAFSECENLSEVSIPESVIEIGNYSFYSCRNISKITLPKSLVRIGGSAFEGCTALTDINIPDKVSSIGDSAFYNCASLASISLPSSVKNIGEYAFSLCISLPEIDIPESVTEIGYNAFEGCSSLSSVKLPKSITSIGWNTFANCSSLSSITIPENVTLIGNKAFYKCDKLSTVEIPDKVSDIGESAFEGCSLFTQITVPEGVVNICDKAFANCPELEGVRISSGVQYIAKDAFENDSKLIMYGYLGSIAQTYADSIGLPVEMVYDVSFDGNGADSGQMAAYTELKANQNYLFPDNGFEKEGYKFVSWNTMPDGSGTEYKVKPGKTTFTNLAPDGKIILYAQWKEKTYTVKFVSNGGKGKMPSQVFVSGVESELADVTYERDGYTFDSWNTIKDGTGISYANKSVVRNLGTDDKEIVMLYAQWKANRFIVKFNSNGGKGKMKSESFTYSKSKALTTCTFKKKGYVFKGWNASKEEAKEGKVKYKDGAKVKNLSKKNKGVVTLYAVWEKEEDSD